MRTGTTAIECYRISPRWYRPVDSAGGQSRGWRRGAAGPCATWLGVHLIGASVASGQHAVVEVDTDCGAEGLCRTTPLRSPSHPHDWPFGLSTGGSERRQGRTTLGWSRTCTAVGSAPACSAPRERNFRVTDDLVATAIDAVGLQKLWNTLRGLTVDMSIGGPLWATKGWPPGAAFDQTLTRLQRKDTVR